MGLDSVELVMEVEKYFSISIPDTEAEKAYTVGKLVDCVARILNITDYDFSLRTNLFAEIKERLQALNGNNTAYQITDKVKDSLDIENKSLVNKLEHALNLQFPGISKISANSQSLTDKLKRWLEFTDVYDFNTITWKKYIDIVLANNLNKRLNPAVIHSKYEIYLAVMKITVDKVGVEYLEIGIEKSFTDDLGID